MDVIIRNLKDFLSYLASSFGLLSGFSAFFPLADVIFKIVPPPKDHPYESTIFATLCCVFLIFLQYSERDNKEKLSSVQKKSIFPSAILYISYIFAIQYIPSLSPYDLYPTVVWELGIASLISFFSVSIKPLAYIAIFYSLTDLFSTLALKEWQKRHGTYY